MNNPQTDNSADTISPRNLLRLPDDIMQLDRMGSSFQHRLSFIRQLLRHAKQGNWRFSKPLADWDDDGYGTAVYQADINGDIYSVVIFTQPIPDDARSDRVIAEQWDACFCLYDGVPDEAALNRLRDNVPKQEKGRCTPNEMVLARANKSMRLFEHAVENLAKGMQPDTEMIQQIGYLMRTTAVYGSGKFGCANREKYCKRAPFHIPFQAEMLSVYLFRQFTIDWLNHIAAQRAKQQNTQPAMLDEKIAQYLGIGNATGLGMAPFMVNHPVLIHHWVLAREQALGTAFLVDAIGKDKQQTFRALYHRAHHYLLGWQVDDEMQSQRILILNDELAKFKDNLPLDEPYPYHAIYQASQQYSLEMQELMVSLLIEAQGEAIDELGDMMSADEAFTLNPAMTIAELQTLLETHYGWALQIDWQQPKNDQTFWYYSEDKMEPRLGNRYTEDGGDLEMPLGAARDIALLYQKCATYNPRALLAELLLQYPECRKPAWRAQLTAHYCYGEIRDNLLKADMRPIDLLRFKLSFFGVSKFDPKSHLWTRVNLFQGAPHPDKLHTDSDELWFFPQKLSQELS